MPLLVAPELVPFLKPTDAPLDSAEAEPRDLDHGLQSWPDARASLAVGKRGQHDGNGDMRCRCVGLTLAERPRGPDRAEGVAFHFNLSPEVLVNASRTPGLDK